MRKNIICLLTFSLCFLIFLPQLFAREARKVRPLLILADVSGSMQRKMVAYQEDGNGEKQNVPKVRAQKELLRKLAENLPSEASEKGIYRVAYKPGRKLVYEPFLSIADHASQEMTDQIEKAFFTEYPVFNRRTALAKMFRQLDEQELGNRNGQITLVLISDGRETEHRKQRSGEPDLIAEVRQLKEKYGDALVLHTVFMRQKREKSETRGEQLLRQMAELGGGKYFSGVELLENRERMAALCSQLYNR